MKSVPLVMSFLLMSGAGLAQQYVISTLAGGAAPPTPSAPMDATIGSPLGVVSDAAGNVYFSGLNCVFKLGPNGALTRVAGNTHPGYTGDGGPATGAELNSPGGVALDNAGNLYIADTMNYRVRKVSPGGSISTVAGNGAVGFSGDGGLATSAKLSAPTGVAVDSAGNLYIADTMNDRVREVSASGIIGTVAGGGTSGLGDGGPATSAQLSAPSGLAVDGAGNLYIADTGYNRVRRVSPNGTINTVAGAGSASYWGDGGPAVSAQVSNPGGVFVDGAGNLYIADMGNNRVRKVSASGIITTIAGSGTGGYSGDGGPATSAQLNAPQGAAMDSAGNLYIADSGNNLVRKVSPDGIIATVAGNASCCLPLGDGGPAAFAQLSAPQGVAVDSGGSLYIGENGAGRVRKVWPGGIITTVAGTGSYGFSGDGGAATEAQLSHLSGLALDSAHNLYIADYGNSRIRMVSFGGLITTIAGDGSNIPLYTGDGGLATAAQLNLPSGVAVDMDGNLYIADAGDHRVRRVSAGGFIATVAGNGVVGYSGDGGPATNAQLDAPAFVAVDNAGNLFIADTYNNRVRKVSLTGIITTVAGNGVQGYSGDGGLATSASLNWPEGVAVDGAGNLYIADRGNNRVRWVSPTGIITTVAGTGALGYSGDGGLATSAQLNGPYGLAIDSAGNIYVADSGNGAVRLLQPVAGSTVLIATSSPLPIGAVGVAYSQTLVASGGALPYIWSVTSGALPAGLALSSGGVIAGTPTAAGTSTFGITVSDAISVTAGQSFNLTISPTSLAIATPSTLPSGSITGAYSQILAATGGVPPYTWSILSGALPPGLALSSAGVIAGTPATTGAYGFTAQAQDSRSATASQAFSLTVTATAALPRAGVFSQIATGGGWDTTIWLVNRSSAPAPTTLVFHGDDGGPLSLPLTVTQPGVSQQVTAATLDRVIAPNTTLVVATGALASNVEGWADVLSNGALSGFAVFRYAGASEAAVPLQSQIDTSISLPFDNTGGYSTGVAIVNLSGSPANLTAVVWDENGNQLVVQSVALTKTDSAGNGHDSFMLPDRLPVTAGKRGIVQFQGNPGSPFASAGAVTGLGLRAGPDGLFTSIPTIVP